MIVRKLKRLFPLGHAHNCRFSPFPIKIWLSQAGCVPNMCEPMGSICSTTLQKNEKLKKLVSQSLLSKTGKFKFIMLLSGVVRFF
jgi:hypothetical protein